MDSLAGKVFAVSGGASGMGLSICRLLAQHKARAICIGDFQDANFAAIKTELQGINASTEVQTVKVDVADSSSVASWIGGIVSAFGALDGCVNAAGVPQVSGVRASPAILEETDEAWRRTIGVNLDGVMYCTREQVRAMVALPKSPRSIVNIASTASLLHLRDVYAYQVSKSAVVHLTMAVAKDTLPFGIRVNAVSPGPTSSPMLRQFFKAGEIAPDFFGNEEVVTPEDVAGVVGYLLSDLSLKVAGANMVVGSGAP